MKQCYKRPSFDFYDTVAMECWLSDLAQQGLILEGTSLAWFRFAKGVPSDIRYRVEPTISENKQPSEEMISTYKEAGWDFVVGLNGLFFIWKSIRADTMELHTDLIVQSESYRRLCKKLTHAALGTSLCVLGIFAIIIGGFLVSDRPVTLFLASPLYLFLAVSELFVVAQVVQQARSALRIKKMLADGFSLSHQKDYRKQYRSYKIISGLSLLFSMAILATAVLTLITDWRKSTVDVEQPLPYLSLDLIEQSEEFAWAEPAFVFDSDIDYNNYVDYTWTPLVPEHYEIRQEGAAQSHKWPDGSGYYTPKATTEYYRLTFSSFAPALFDELMDQYLWEYEEYTIGELDAFDRTVIAQDKKHSITHLFVQCGNQVIYIRYQGYADLRERLELLSKAL